MEASQVALQFVDEVVKVPPPDKPGSHSHLLVSNEHIYFDKHRLGDEVGWVHTYKNQSYFISVRADNDMMKLCSGHLYPITSGLYWRAVVELIKLLHTSYPEDM